MKIIVEDSFGITGKLITIIFNSGLVTNPNGKKVLQKSSIGPMEVSNERFQKLRQMYLDDQANGTDNLYQLIKSKVSETNPRTEIVLGDDPPTDKDGVLIDQNSNPQLDVD